MAVVHRPMSQPLARVAHPADGASQLRLAHAHVGRHLQPAHWQGTEYQAPSRSARATCGTPSPSAPQPSESHPQAAAASRPAPPRIARHRASVAVSQVVAARASSRSISAADRVEVQGLPGIGTSSRPHCAATGTPPLPCRVRSPAREARLEEVMTGERLEPRAQLSLAAHDSPHRRAQIVVQQPVGHPAQVGEGPDMSFEKADLILPREEPGEVPAGEHRPQQKQMRLLPLAPRRPTSTSKKSISPRGLPAGRPAARRPRRPALHSRT